MQGVIKVLKNGFGFIQPENGSKDLFFHATDLNSVQFDDLNEGDTVTFNVVDSDRGGQKAADVSLVSAEE